MSTAEKHQAFVDYLKKSMEKDKSNIHPDPDDGMDEFLENCVLPNGAGFPLDEW